MKPNTFNNQVNDSSPSIGTQARLLLSQSRAKQQNRQQSMLHRAAEEVGINS